MTTGQKRIKEVAESTGYIDLLNKGFIRSAFELEYQSANGSSDEREIDWDRFYDDVSDSWHSTDTSDQKDYFQDSDMGELYEALSVCGYNIYDGLTGIAYREMESAFDGARENYEDYCRENWDMDDYYEDSDIDVDTGDYRLEVGRDESVEGGEIKPYGKNTPQRCLSMTRYLFENNDFDIDHKCSYHIHLSVNGVQHVYGKQLQAEMLAYILDRDLPAYLKKRLNRNSRRHYKTLISTDKFSAIHFHRGFGTWEFRLFGNISDTKEARYCMRLAVEALRWAYRVKLGLEKSLLGKLSSKDTQELFAELEHDKDYRLDSKIREYRTANTPHNQAVRSELSA